MVLFKAKDYMEQTKVSFGMNSTKNAFDDLFDQIKDKTRESRA
jgi:hypothetical protein